MGIFHGSIVWLGRPFVFHAENISERPKMNNKKYREEYKNWFDGLSPKEKERLKKIGLDKPLDDNRATFTPDSEAVFSRLGTEFDYESLDKSEEVLDMSAVEEKAKAYGALLLCWVFQRLQSHSSEKTALMDKDALLFSLGLENLLEIKTETALAKHYRSEERPCRERV